MGVSGAQQWWHEWQLRILVLSSLFIQTFLSCSALVRRIAIPTWLRSIRSLAYAGGDALAIYALATIFNRHKEQTADRGSSALELIWAPVLLVHLGGQSNIAAYSLEDHLLWKQHAIIVVSKVTVALYVFIKWWSGEKRLLYAAVFLLIFGIVKFAEKPWCLWRGSYDKVVASVSASRRSIEQDELTLGEYVQEAIKCVQQDAVVAEYGENHFHLKMLFADVPAPYSRRLKELRSIMKFMKHEDRLYGMLYKCHRDIFQRLYAKTADSRRSPFSWKNFLRDLLNSYLIVLSSALIFTQSHKDEYSQNDVKVTYTLLWCTTALELLPVFTRFFDFAGEPRDGRVSQYNLMRFCALKKKPTILMKLATFNCVRKYLYEHWNIDQKFAAVEITKLVHTHVKDGWNNYIHNTASYRVFNNFRGQWTLHRLAWDTDKRQRVCWSLKVPFDESVLLWHIATDLCFHHPKSCPQDRQKGVTQSSRKISNYMFYLLSICPEMLMPGTRSALSTVASNDIDLIWKNSNAPLDNEEMLAREIIDRMKPTTTRTEKITGTLISDACRLAEELMELGDENERWQVIQGVWVEMLCYSAARCRGYLHAKSLGDGGEYLSYVWLLWSFMGMETLAEKMQRPEPPREEEIAAAGAPASPSQGVYRDGFYAASYNNLPLLLSCSLDINWCSVFPSIV